MRCYECSSILEIGDTIYDYNDELFCSEECVFEHIKTFIDVRTLEEEEYLNEED